MTAGFETLRWREAGGRSPPALVLLDQTRLPEEERRIPCADVESVAEAIESLRVRGAPAIGVAAAYGVAVGAWHGIGSGCMRAIVEGAVERLGRTRPTAVNLFQALDRMDSALEEAAGLTDAEVYHRLVARPAACRPPTPTSAGASASTGRLCWRTATRCSPTATLAPWPPPGGAPRWVSSTPPPSPARGSTSTPARPAPCSRGRG